MPPDPTDALDTYRRKRDFSRTPEPDGTKPAKGRRPRKTTRLAYVVQKHAATRLHFDFRLELDGVLKSWAVTRGPSLNPADRRLAVRTEDHPLAYGSFEGVIPAGYGAGTVMLWDQGEWIPKSDPTEGLARGSLKFELRGERLKGGWALVRMKGRKQDKGRENWLLIKERDKAADESFDPLSNWTESITSGRDLAAIAQAPARRKSAPLAKDNITPLPAFTPPQLATLREDPPSGPDWLHELKFDGYRIQALIAGKQVRLITRNGKDWTARYPSISAALSHLTSGSAALDGELVALDPNGISDFSALQAATESGRDEDLAYFAFDLLSLDGKSLRQQPLEARKAALRKLLPAGDAVLRFSDHVAGTGSGVIAQACGLGLEGIVSKKRSATYRSGRSASWTKSKCVGRDEFVIGGYRRSDKKGRAFASLLVGEYEGGVFVYRGRVGAGFSDADLGALSSAMAPLQRKTPAFGKLPPEARQDAVWLTPRLVIETAYAGRTAGGLLRHARFLGLREDKAGEEVAAAPTASADTSDDTEESILGVRVSSAGASSTRTARPRATSPATWRSLRRACFLISQTIRSASCAVRRGSPVIASSRNMPAPRRWKNSARSASGKATERRPTTSFSRPPKRSLPRPRWA
jgi:bifunctional non-homologous end joining protein LigD